MTTNFGGVQWKVAEETITLSEGNEVVAIVKSGGYYLYIQSNGDQLLSPH